MNKLVKKLACGMLVATMAITGMAGCGSTAEEHFDGTQILLSNENDSLNAGVANFMLRTSQAQMQEYLQTYGQADGGVWETYGSTVKDSTLDTLITMLVMRAHAEEYGITLTAAEKQRIDSSAAAFVKDNGEEVMKELGMTEDDVKTILELYTYQSKMYVPMTEDIDTEVSEEEAAQATISYLKLSFVEVDAEGNSTPLSEAEKEERRAAMQQGLDQMLASDDVLAMDLNAVAEELHDNMFASASLSFSINDLEAKATTIDVAVKEAVLENLEDGAVITEVIEGADAFYAVRVEKAFDEEATEAQKESIIQQRKYEVYNAMLSDWKDEAAYELDEDVWASMEVTDAHIYKYKAEEEPAE